MPAGRRWLNLRTENCWKERRRNVRGMLFSGMNGFCLFPVVYVFSPFCFSLSHNWTWIEHLWMAGLVYTGAGVRKKAPSWRGEVCAFTHTPHGPHVGSPWTTRQLERPNSGLEGQVVPIGPPQEGAACPSTDPASTAPAPVIDVSPWVDVPALDGCPHALLHLLPLGFTDAPGFGPIKHDVGEDAAGVVGNLNSICLALQQVATKNGEKWSPDPQGPLQIQAADSNS